MRKIRVNKKVLKIAAVLAAVLLTATILTSTAIQNQNQNTVPLINAYLQGVSPGPNNAIILPKMGISTSTTLNGSVYYETINVLASNIVIDGNGSTIQGPANGTGCGFYLNGVSNVTIFNVTVTGWRYGFYLNNSVNNNLSGNTANYNIVGFTGYGFYLYSSPYNNLSGNTANSNLFGYGFVINSSSYNTLSGNTANGGDGFYLYSSVYNNLSGNTANGNLIGFELGSSVYNTLSGNTANNNILGFGLYSSSYNILTGNTANKTYNSGFHLDSSSYNILTGNTANDNTDSGFDLASSSNNNYLSSNNATNSNFSFYLDTCTGNQILGNIALNSTTQGYFNSSSSGNNFTGSVVANYLRVNVTDSGGLPISGAQVLVVSNGTVWYATPAFGGSGSPTGADGLTPWFAVPYQTYMTDNSTTTNNNTVTVSHSTLWQIASFSNNPRTGVGMSTSHTENFTVASWQPTALQTMLPVLLLAGTQGGGVSPLVYAAIIGVVGVVVVAGGLIYYFRRVKA